jgi:hypothetical protein
MPIRLIMAVIGRGIVASERVLPNPGGDVSPDAVLEYARAVSPRYLKAGKRSTTAFGNTDY